MKQANARLLIMLGFGTTEFLERKEEPGAVFVSKLVCIAMRSAQIKTARHLDKSVFMHDLAPPAKMEFDRIAAIFFAPPSTDNFLFRRAELSSFNVVCPWSKLVWICRLLSAPYSLLSAISHGSI